METKTFIRKPIITLALLFIVCFSFGQTDSIKVRPSNLVPKECLVKKKKNKYIQILIGETYHKIVPADGWFKLYGDCPNKIYELPIVECNFPETRIGVYIKLKKGKPFSGNIKEKSEKYKLITRCKKGLLHGTVKILNLDDQIIWQGEFIMGKFQNVEK